MKKRKYLVWFAAAVALFCLIYNLGIGYYSSGSAVLDLKEELKALHGEPYTGREVENGIENMEFSVEPATFFLTDYSLRRFLGWDYHYKCEVTYTVYSGGEISSVSKITYTGIDPMGHDKTDLRAYLDMEDVKGQSSMP